MNSVMKGVPSTWGYTECDTNQRQKVIEQLCYKDDTSEVLLRTFFQGQEGKMGFPGSNVTSRNYYSTNILKNE